MNNKNYKPYVLNQDGSYTEIIKADELVIDPVTTAWDKFDEYDEQCKNCEHCYWCELCHDLHCDIVINGNKEDLCEYEEREI